MNALEFRKPALRDADEITAFKQECEAYHSGMDGTGILFKSSAKEWLAYNLDMEARDRPEIVPSLQYGLFEKDSGRLLGLIQLRLELKGYLIDFGGHIGYCVRPTQRRRGYAKEMLRQALDVCRQEGLDRVLVTCLADNVGSAKTIEACGGVYEKTVYDDKNYLADMKRYWIALS